MVRGQGQASFSAFLVAFLLLARWGNSMDLASKKAIAAIYSSGVASFDRDSRAIASSHQFNV